ncbi:MAG: hypothetical protein AUH85_06640 [Chloroflexi bacterium 13_1_40CM_4_68_4]|nr:MAG: hypothetical protein AUH85_06640 [Chloroflexi bacterium 13_1_40CM_4_68_4]
MNRRQIVEVKRRLDGTETRFNCEPVLIEAGRRAVILYILDRAWAVEGVALRPGMKTYAHFWMDRPYNAYHWLDGERTVGLYFNVGACSEISPARVAWTDYVVDILVTPDRTATVLDEDELGVETPLEIRQIVDETRTRILRELPALIAEIEAETRRLRAGA